MKTEKVTSIKQFEVETNELKATITNDSIKYGELKKRMDKAVKDKDKSIREFDAKLVSIDDELKKSYTKVDTIYKEYVKLAEEKKVL